MGVGRKGLDVCSGAVFDRHVLEFARFKDFAAFQAFYEFGVFFTGHDLHAGMLTLIHFASLIGGWRRRGWSHNPGNKAEGLNTLSSGIFGILDPRNDLSSTLA